MQAYQIVEKIEENDRIIGGACTEARLDIKKSGIHKLSNKIGSLAIQYIFGNPWQRLSESLVEDFLLLKYCASSLIKFMQGKPLEYATAPEFLIHAKHCVEKETYGEIPDHVVDKITKHYKEICDIYFSQTRNDDLRSELGLV